MTPYERFLKIPESETPPDHYRLLGIPRFTSDLKAIHSAMIERNSLLKSWDNSGYYRESNAVLDEVIAAAAVLEDPARKSAYDAQLRGEALPAPEEEIVFEVYDPSSEVEPEPLSETESDPDLIAKVPPPPLPAAEVIFGAVHYKMLILGVGLTALGFVIAVPFIAQRDTRPLATAPGEVATQSAPDAKNPPKAPLKPLLEIFTSVVLSPDGKLLASANLDNNVTLWDAETCEEIRTLYGHTAPVRCVAFSQDGNWMASGGDDQTLMVWNTTTGQNVNIFKGHSGPIRSIAFSFNALHVVSAADDGLARIWNVYRDQEAFSLEGHTEGLTSAVFSPDGLRVVSAGQDLAIKVWFSMSGTEEQTLESHTDTIRCLAFSRDGIHFASGSDDQTVILWNVTEGQPESTFEGHSDPVTALAFNPDGTRLASATAKGNVKIWNLRTGEEVHDWQARSGRISSVTFGDNGMRLYSVGTDPQVRVWTISLIGTPAFDPGPFPLPRPSF